MEGGEPPTNINGGEQKGLQRTRVFSRYPLPSDRHPFSAHFEILRRFVAYGRTQPVSAERVEGEGVPVQAASMNVRFMASVGLIKFESKGRYTPTPDTVRFVNARSVSDERARPVMRVILANSWFAEAATNLLRAQPIVSEDQLVGELALASETDKIRKEPALQILVDYLLYSGIVMKGEKGLALGDSSQGDLGSSGESRPSDSLGAPAGSESGNKVLGQAIPTLESGTWLVVQTDDFYLKVRSTEDALEYLEDQLKLIRKRIERRNKPQTPLSSDGGRDAEGSAQS
jgi:hypothetical protein